MTMIMNAVQMCQLVKGLLNILFFQTSWMVYCLKASGVFYTSIQDYEKSTARKKPNLFFLALIFLCILHWVPISQIGMELDFNGSLAAHLLFKIVGY